MKTYTFQKIVEETLPLLHKMGEKMIFLIVSEFEIIKNFIRRSVIDIYGHHLSSFLLYHPNQLPSLKESPLAKDINVIFFDMDSIKSSAAKQHTVMKKLNNGDYSEGRGKVHFILISTSKQLAYISIPKKDALIKPFNFNMLSSYLQRYI